MGTGDTNRKDQRRAWAGAYIIVGLGLATYVLWFVAAARAVSITWFDALLLAVSAQMVVTGVLGLRKKT